MLSPFQRDILLATPAAPEAFVRALVRCARERHWRLITDPVHTGVAPWRWQGHGLIAFAAAGSDGAADPAGGGRPNVTVSLTPGCQVQPRVELDQRAIGALAARHLLERDCREFIWAPFTEDAANRDRLRGFQSALRAEGHECRLLPPAYRRIGHAWNDNAREWRQAALALLGSMHRSTGVFAFNDCLSSRAVAIAREAGFDVPDQVAVVGVGNDPLDCESGAIALSSIDPDLEGMTLRAAALLDRLIGGQRTEEIALHPPKGVITRASTMLDRRQDTRIEQAVAYVAAHSTDPHLSVAAVADHIGVSRRQLERDFRTFKGCTVRELIEDMRMQAAARLVLEHPHSKVLAIAEAIGIPDPNSFFRKFRKRFGTTPGAFRRQFRALPENDVMARPAS